MKNLIVIVVLSAAIGLSHQILTKEEVEDMLYSVMKVCSKKEDANKQDVGHIAGRNPPESYVQKCLSACIGETVGLLKDGKMDGAKAVDLAITAFGEGDPKVALAEELTHECAGISDPDRCEYADKVYACS